MMGEDWRDTEREGRTREREGGREMKVGGDVNRSKQKQWGRVIDRSGCGQSVSGMDEGSRVEAKGQ